MDNITPVCSYTECSVIHLTQLYVLCSWSAEDKDDFTKQQLTIQQKHKGTALDNHRASKRLIQRIPINPILFPSILHLQFTIMFLQCMFKSFVGFSSAGAGNNACFSFQTIQQVCVADEVVSCCVDAGLFGLEKLCAFFEKGGNFSVVVWVWLAE